MCWRLISIICLISIIIFSSVNISSIEKDNNAEIKVEVKGEVINPGVFYLRNGSKIGDLFKEIEFTKSSDLSCISLLDTLYNNQIIVIPKQKQYTLISINNASISELCKLPGIGTSTAEKIINYRNTYGSFICLEDLKKVNGIGDKKYENIKEYICL